MSSLKPLVNNKDLWDSFKAHIEEQVQLAYSRLSVADDHAELHRIQGEIRALRRLTYLREKINGNAT